MLAEAGEFGREHAFAVALKTTAVPSVVTSGSIFTGADIGEVYTSGGGGAGRDHATTSTTTCASIPGEDFWRESGRDSAAWRDLAEYGIGHDVSGCEGLARPRSLLTVAVPGHGCPVGYPLNQEFCDGLTMMKLSRTGWTPQLGAPSPLWRHFLER